MSDTNNNNDDPEGSPSSGHLGTAWEAAVVVVFGAFACPTYTCVVGAVLMDLNVPFSLCLSLARSFARHLPARSSFNIHSLPACSCSPTRSLANGLPTYPPTRPVAHSSRHHMLVVSQSSAVPTYCYLLLTHTTYTHPTHSLGCSPCVPMHLTWVYSRSVCDRDRRRDMPM